MTDNPEPDTGGGGEQATGDPTLFRTYIVPPGATVDDLVEVAIEAFADSDGWAGQIRDEANHVAIIYNATAATIAGIQFVFRPLPDHIGPVTAEPTEPIPPPEPQPAPPAARRGRVTAAGLNVRADPWVPSEILATVKYDDILVIKADYDDYWYDVQWDAPGHDHAFVSKKYVQEL